VPSFRSDLDPTAGLPPSEQTLPPPPPGLPPPGGTRRRGVWGSLATAVGLLAVKLKSALALLKIASLGKFALTALSMLAMVAVEAQRGGWLFGLGFVALIFVHEMGHAVAIRRAGLEAGWPVFIPFFGAMIALKGRPASRDVEARIAYAGPLAGTAASLLAAGLFALTGSRVWLALAYTGFFLNLFNLIPISPLDGGRIAQVFSRRAAIVGGVLLGAMFLVTMAPQLLLIGIVAVMHNFRRGETQDRISETTDSERSGWSLRYFALCFFLGAGVYLSSRVLRGSFS
jgi:Zn-dependent protease